VSGLISIGIRLVKKKGNDYLIAKEASVYDIDTGRLLPAKHVKIVLDPNDFVTAEVTLDVADLVIEEA
jgi:hypothetical protein